MRGALDVLRLATAALPSAMMNMATRDSAHYADGFVTHWEIEVWNPGNRAHMLSGMSTYLRGMRWQIHSGRADDVLSLTERLTDHAASQDAARLIQALVTSLSEAPDLTSDPAARDWLNRMRGQYPPETAPRTKVMEPPSVRPHGSAAPPLYPYPPAPLEDEVETIVGRCVAAFHHGRPYERVFDGLTLTQAITSGTSALRIVGRLYDGLITFGAQDEVAYGWAMALADRVVRGEFGQEVAADFDREVRRSSLFQAMFRINLLATVADRGAERPLDLTDDDRHRLKEIREHTDLMAKNRRKWAPFGRGSR